MDWDLLMKLGLQYPVVPIDSVLARARVHQAAKTSTGGRRRFRELVRVIRRYSDTARPPSYWVYGLDTYKTIADNTVDRLTARFPRIRGRGHHYVNRAYDALAMRTFLKCDDWVDGLAGEALNLLVPPGPGRVQLVGEVPPDLAPQPLVISSGGTRVWAEELPVGPFVIQLPVEGDDNTKVLSLSVTAARSRPHGHPWRLGLLRPVAYALQRVERA
jgi:hypothetical protein